MREEFFSVLDELLETQALLMIDREHFLLMLDGKVIGSLVAPEDVQSQKTKKRSKPTRQLHFFKAKPSRKYQAIIGNQVLLSNDLQRLVRDAQHYYRMKVAQPAPQDASEPIYQV